jgi:hypothetical protein
MDASASDTMLASDAGATVDAAGPADRPPDFAADVAPASPDVAFRDGHGGRSGRRRRRPGDRRHHRLALAGLRLELVGDQGLDQDPVAGERARDGAAAFRSSGW